jgi:Ca2+/Na+ antiporter
MEWNGIMQRTRQEHNQLIDRSDEAVESVENPGWCITKAVALLLLGAAIAAAFADPLVDAVHNFSNATHIPSFFISFIALPLATNSSEAVSAIIFASRKKQRTCSLTFSEVRGRCCTCTTLPLTNTATDASSSARDILRGFFLIRRCMAA